MHLHLHVRIHRWVRWWFYVGAVCGLVALANILGRELSPAQIRIILAIGIAHWLLGGVICYASDGIQIEIPKQSAPQRPTQVREPQEWHPASDFILPGNRKRLLPPLH